MKIGIQSAFSGATPPDLIADFGRIVEECGFHSLWVPEHVVFFRDYASRYTYSDDGKLPGNPDGVMEPLTALTFLAAHTEHVRLGTGVLLVPQRNPIYTAKQVADVDYLSKGRLDFGIGIGWLREEFDALGVPWERRADRDHHPRKRSLYGSSGNQLVEGLGSSAQRRRKSEADETDEERRSETESIPKPAGRRRHHRQCKGE